MRGGCVIPNRAEQLDAEVVQFMRDNPTVYPKFRMLALKLKVKGIDRWGAKAIWEVLRYEMALKSVTTGEKVLVSWLIIAMPIFMLYSLKNLPTLVLNISSQCY